MRGVAEGVRYAAIQFTGSGTPLNAQLAPVLHGVPPCVQYAVIPSTENASQDIQLAWLVLRTIQNLRFAPESHVPVCASPLPAAFHSWPPATQSFCNAATKMPRSESDESFWGSLKNLDDMDIL